MWWCVGWSEAYLGMIYYGVARMMVTWSLSRYIMVWPGWWPVAYLGMIYNGVARMMTWSLSRLTYNAVARMMTWSLSGYDIWWYGEDDLNLIWVWYMVWRWSEAYLGMIYNGVGDNLKPYLGMIFISFSGVSSEWKNVIWHWGWKVIVSDR